MKGNMKEYYRRRKAGRFPRWKREKGMWWMLSDPTIRLGFLWAGAPMYQLLYFFFWAQGKQANQKTRFTCRKQKLRARRTQPLTKQERKEAKSDSNHMPSFSGPCLPSCTMQGNMLSNYFVNANLWVVLETFLRRRKFNLIPFLKC